ncbi:hypothetical protein GCK72_016588 [Caenorhabditis remanei]|uniref:Uncharacterized protein n=1 Tax=Caenorhabditis remanei TaxID=31234 RepID=A0A2P4W0L2_CAERE|nr:hypothetical protein GCK72_016588 [Caenorhabditis remanei]KAF1750043.1 hypothetical protein GCK72_016588 [Caenorhabditis remanei]
MSLNRRLQSIFLISVIIISECVLSVTSDTLSEIPMPKGASCPQSILRPSLLFYLTPVFIAFLIFNKNITSDIRHMYGN